MKPDWKTIIVSRTDGIGDVVLTLPLVGALRSMFPKAQLIFIGRTYTAPAVALSKHVDQFIDWNQAGDEQAAVELLRSLRADAIFHVFPERTVVDAAYQANIPVRIGTGRRWHTWRKCNRRLWFGRKGSDLHESQLNLKMLQAIGVKKVWPLAEEIELYGIKVPYVSKKVHQLLSSGGAHIILHPKSHGSAIEWGVHHFAELAGKLNRDGVTVFITGTAKERAAMAADGDPIPWGQPNVVDLCGELSLSELTELIGASDVLVAASTGPLHLAAAMGIGAIGLYSPQRPIHPTRWAPLGVKARTLCSSTHPEDGVLDISVDSVVAEIDDLLNGSSK
jgi:ADP-heptose:LPS heptosyltransferase